MATARVFRSGNSQAVRLPKEYRLKGMEVEIFRRGDEIVLREKAEGLVRAFEILAGLPDDFFPEGRGGGTELSSTSQAAPSNAIKAFEKAREDWLNQNSDGAEKNLKKAIQLYPGFAQAWLQLGEIQEVSDPKDARDSFSKASAADPKFVLPYEQLARLAAQADKWQETLENTSRALQLDPAGTPQIWYYDAMAKFQLGKTDEALASAKRALENDPRHIVLAANAEDLLAIILARKADYTGALQHLKNCLTYIPAGPQADLVKQQIAQLERKATPAK